MHSIAISLLSEAGLQGPQAEVALRHALSNLAAPSPRARQALAQLGIAVEDLDPSLKSLPEIVRQLADADLGEDAAQAIFNETGAPAMLALIQRVDRLEAMQSS